MKVYKTFIFVMIPLCVISFIFAFYLNAQNPQPTFWINILQSVFASALLVLITSIVSYLVERNKINANFKYSMKLQLHQLKQFDLYLKLFPHVEPVNGIVIIKIDPKETSEIIKYAYQTSYIIDEIFVDLSLKEVKSIYGEEFFNNTNELTTMIENFAIAVHDNYVAKSYDPDITYDLIKTFRANIKKPINELEYKSELDYKSLKNIFKNHSKTDKAK